MTGTNGEVALQPRTIALTALLNVRR